MADISREEIDRLYQTLDAGFSGINARLDKQNGRIGTAETAIAVLSDRGVRVSDPGARWTAAAAVVAAAIAGFVAWFKG